MAFSRCAKLLKNNKNTNVWMKIPQLAIMWQLIKQLTNACGIDKDSPIRSIILMKDRKIYCDDKDYNVMPELNFCGTIYF